MPTTASTPKVFAPRAGAGADGAIAVMSNGAYGERGAHDLKVLGVVSTSRRLSAEMVAGS